MTQFIRCTTPFVRIGFIAAFLFISSSLFASINLVPNPGFEECKRYPNEAKQLSCIPAWKSPNGGTPDYFHANSVINGKVVGIPKNFAGKQDAHSGSAYVGLALFDDSDERYREFLEVKLIRPLIKGKRYRTKMYVSLADLSSYAVAEIGMLFTTDMYKGKKPELISKPQVANSESLKLNDKKGWICIEGEFTAQGGEEFLTLGNFKKNTNDNFFLVEKSVKSPVSYYYFDDISVEELNDNNYLDTAPITDIKNPFAIPTSSFSNEPSASTTPTIKEIKSVNIYFDHDRAEINQKTIPELNEIFAALEESPLIEIEIVGHADNSGKSDYNKKLSLERATNIAKYLAAKGIFSKRIQVRGQGDNQPVVAGDMSERKAKSRRVEVVILKKSGL